ncbi:LysR family transcriptional regulator [Marinobacter hydrocarbonoclasticus]|nr:LysR family transcriptional regulator [Marinobacter nauticus]
MDLIKAMRTFVAVVEQGSFSSAALQQGIVTSAISRQVTELENHYGCQLLLRSTRSMRLTPEGQYFLAEFEGILARVDQLESGASDRRGEIAGRIRLSSPQHTAQLGLQPALSAFLAAHPGVTLSWLSVNRHVNLVEEGVDLAVRVGELPDSGLVARPLARVVVEFVASPDYLARYGTPAHPRELTQHRCLVDNSNPQLARWRYYEDGVEHHLRVPGTLEVNQGELAAQFGADGVGIAQLPRFMVAPYIDSGQLVTLLHEYRLPPVPVSLVYPANRTTSAPVRALVDHLLNHKPTQAML